MEANNKGPSTPQQSHQSTLIRHPARTPIVDHPEPPKRPNFPSTNNLDQKLDKEKETTNNSSTNKTTINNKKKPPSYSITRERSKTQNDRRLHLTTAKSLNNRYEEILDQPSQIRKTPIQNSIGGSNDVTTPHKTTVDPTTPLVETVLDDNDSLPLETYDPMAGAPNPLICFPSPKEQTLGRSMQTEHLMRRS